MCSVLAHNKKHHRAGEDVSSTGESSVDVKKTDRDLAGTTARWVLS
jgi:hypothetical protein